jgi:hypothetical protein
MVRFVLSRTVDNQERPSLGNVLQKRSVYSEQDKDKKKIF